MLTLTTGTTGQNNHYVLPELSAITRTICPASARLPLSQHGPLCFVGCYKLQENLHHVYTT